MNDEHQTTMGQIKDHRFIIFIGGSIVVALFLVAVALGLYASSGAAQLDLSRPGYASLRGEAKDEDVDFEGFRADGTLDGKALQEFENMYGDKMKEILSVDAFGGDVLSPQSLEIDKATAAKTNKN